VTNEESRTLGFLFADLRGYSAFVEGHGDAAGAALLRAYRDLVRAEVARFNGAEIRTEGDSFYVVFPSASGAVRCGMAVLAAAFASNSAAGGHIRVGLGVHAGETTETDEGYVGSAVNIAARVCSVARPGELLVTDTVHSIVRTRLPLRFVPRGTRRLKGISQPVEVFRVEATAGATVGTTARPSVRDWVRRQPALLGMTAAAAIILLVGVSALGALLGSERSAPTPTPAAQGAAQGTQTASPDVPESDTFPNAAEQELLAAVHPDLRPRCRRADAEDAPTFQFIGEFPPQRITVEAGLRCMLEGPTVVSIWHASPNVQRQLAHPDGFLQQIIDRNSVPEGDCAAVDKAHHEWEFGDGSGRVLCRPNGDTAILVWTYHGTTVLGIASRSDGDNAALYRWWLDHGRTLTGL
jgi:class 3 adenylate cyclase